MYILSIDIGIKNFAYCLISYQNNDYNIEKWDVINIGLNKRCFIKNCKKNVKYEKDNVYYCFSHSKLSNLKKQTKKNSYNNMKNESLENILNFCNKYKFDKKEIYEIISCKNKQKQKTQLLEKIKEYYDNNYLQTINGEKCNNMSLIEIGKNMMTIFDDIFKDIVIDVVLIENQISPIATRMKTLQGMVSQYFIMREIKNIQFVSSSNKLKYFLNKKLNYKQKKEKAIDVMKEILTNKLNLWEEYFLSNSKKDDLADSFLQGYWFLLNNIMIKLNILN
jgi:hypothetical protein